MSTQIVKFWFWFLWSIDAVIAAIALYFFFSLAADDRIRSFNIVPWLLILVALAAVVGGSICCDRLGRARSPLFCFSCWQSREHLSPYFSSFSCLLIPIFTDSPDSHGNARPGTCQPL